MQFAALVLPAAFVAYQPQEPVIGVLAYPGTDLGACPQESGGGRDCAAARQARFAESYIDSSYARWLEASGARAVPIRHDLPADALRALFGKINGVVFTGGPAKPLEAPPHYYDTASALYSMVVAAHERGERVPLWGTCLGLQTISCIAAGAKDVLGDFPLEGYAYPLDFTSEAASSRLFGGLAPSAIADFAQNVTTNWHHFGVSPEDLPPSLVPLATNRALNGRTFVSALEGRHGLPVYAVQFHPESVQWDPQDAYPVPSGTGVPSKSAAAIRTAQYLGNFIVDQARNNSHRFETALEEARALISQQMTLEFHRVAPSGGGTPWLHPEGAYLFSKSEASAAW
eukprot:575101-Prymnesium_polylepis.2